MQIRLVSVLTALSCIPLVSCVHEIIQDATVQNGSRLCLNAVTDGMLEQYEVTTKGTDIKTSEEQEIKTLHVFIFDSDGNYLEASDSHRYQGYRSITGGKTVMNIDREGWADSQAAKSATIIAVANVEAGTFIYTSADTPPDNIGNRDALLGFIYRPLTERAVTSLPESGMPMFGMVKDVDLTSTNSEQSIDIMMRALMARIDVSLQINSNHTDITGALPSLAIEKCEIVNAPSATKFQENVSSETDLATLGKENYSWQPPVQTIRNQSGRVDFTFYTFENLQEPAVTDYEYPDGITDDMKQRYKPEIADEDNSLAFRFSGTYITYNGGVYDAEYTLYLGANHTDDFKVMRNKQYKNNITIKGIENVGTNTQHVTFDARVDIVTSNPYFVSMLKERTMDSHFNVVPMDVYFFNNTPTGITRPNQTIDVSVDVDWIRFEKVDSAMMADGKAPYGDCIATGTAWQAGNGKRKYFTTDLVTTTLASSSSITGLKNRDRVYLYVDENLEVWHLGTQEERTRMATVKITYKEDGKAVSSRELVLEQSKLLEVTYNVGDSGDEEAGLAGQSFYIEAYEEYLDYADPLDEYNSELVYNGLPWEDYSGSSGTTIGSISVGFFDFVNCCDNYYNGLEFTEKIAQEVEAETRGGYTHLHLNAKPKTAAGYCYIKNKRDSNGGVPNPKWFLPGIRQLERILEDYYIDYPEFREHYYWSSAAGERGNDPWNLYNENRNYARATQAFTTDQGFDYKKSFDDGNCDYDEGEGGYASRKTILRIRAARIDNLAQ